jgi:hypothetical protein
MQDDVQHLQLLSVFHYVLGGITALFGCFPIFHLAMGIAVVTGVLDDENGPPPAFGWLFIGMAAIAMTFLWALAIAILVAGRKLATHTGYMYCMVVAAIECAFMPLGTILGVFTIIVLVRPSVKELFGVRVV